jgi:hypothetical protein
VLLLLPLATPTTVVLPLLPAGIICTPCFG